MIRLVTPDDVDWAVGVAQQRYRAFDVNAAKAWGLAALGNPKICVVRGGKAFAVGAINSPFYDPTVIRGYCVFVASEGRAGFEPCRLLRFLIQWAFNEHGAQSFHLGSGTGQDMGPLAKRIGAVADEPSYVVMRHG